MNPDYIQQRLRYGLKRLRQQVPRSLPGLLLSKWTIAALIAALIFGGIEGVVAVLLLRLLYVVWQLGAAMPAAAAESAGRKTSSFSTKSLAGVFAMSPLLKPVLTFGGAALVLWLFAPFTIVPAGNRGVITTFGKVTPEVLDEGIHFRIPIAQSVHLMDVRIQKGEGAGDAASKDLQQVHTSVALNYHIDPKEAAVVFRDVGPTIGDRIVVPAVQEAVKAATAQYTAEELITKRQEVRDRIRALLVERLTRHGVAVDEFSIVNFAFSKSFNEAIEAKTTAEQLKLKAERDLQRIRVEAEQKVTQAKAEAESLALQKQQVTVELIRLREIENQRKAIEKWDGKLPQVSGAATPFINVTPSH
ncbi:MAG TPA: SPFH domain-containing protein [Rhodocyclaceae bacterium]